MDRDTYIYTKDHFMKWLNKQIDDDEYVVFTSNLVGNVSVNAKRNVKKIQFGLAANAFKNAGDISHLAFGETPCVAVCIAKKESLSDDTLNLLKEIKL
jgi:hypothetical protein